jgi:signal transduction histidine kinase/CheY-like chemotaxis protein/HPt (histidine-containing phosphotransfer) domain-containing protein
VVLIFFIMAVGGILFAGGLAWMTLEKMLSSIDHLAEPNRKQELLHNINANLSRLHQVYRNVNFSNIPPAAQDQQRLLTAIEQDIDSLKVLSLADGYEMKGLDSIVLLIHKTEKGTKELMSARQKNSQQSTPAKLIKELSKQINSFKQPDSSYLVKSTITEIRIADNTLQTIDSLSRLGVINEKERAGIFNKISRMFGRKERKAAPAQQKIVLAPERQVDTLTKVSVDSVNLGSNESLLLSLQEYLQKLYEAEIKSIRQLNRLEKSMQAQNAALLNTTEQMVAEIQAQERERNQKARREAYLASGSFNTTLYLIILFFVGVGLLLLLLLLRDIRQSNYYQRQLVLEKEKADREARAKQDFLAFMSHEIRTPLTSIVGYADLLQDTDEHHQAIKKSSDHLLHIANEILDLAKIESGIIETQPEPVHLTQLLQDIERTFGLKIKNKGLEGIFDLPDDPDLLVSTDPYRLNQVLYNLLHNAVKFTEKGRIHFQARVQDLPGERVQLTVRVKDTGIGIHRQDQKRIFEAYQQAGPHAYKREGSGLGLGIVKKVVNLLGGTISVRSKPGKGTVFTTTFPFSRAAPLPVAVPIREEPTLFAGKSFLIVDDDPLIARLHRLILTAYGATVETVTNPLKAIERVKEARFDLAILDLQMPELSGAELLDRISAFPNRPAKIIVSTANVLLSGQHLDQLSAFDDLLYKPVRKAELVKIVAGNLGLALAPAAAPAATPPLPLQASPAGYDLTDLQKLTMGDKELLKDILLQFYSQNKEDLSLAKEYLENDRPMPLADVVHKLASRFGQIQAVQASHLVRKVENDLRNGQLVKEIYALVEEWEWVNEKVHAEHQLSV